MHAYTPSSKRSAVASLAVATLAWSIPALLSGCGGSVVPASVGDSGPGAEDHDVATTDSAASRDAIADTLADTPSDTRAPDDGPANPSCAFTVEPVGPPCEWTAFYPDTLPSQCAGPAGSSVAAQCATLCGANSDGVVADSCEIGSGSRVDCFVTRGDVQCGVVDGGGFP